MKIVLSKFMHEFKMDRCDGEMGVRLKR